MNQQEPWTFRMRRYFTGYQGPGQPRSTRSVVRTIVTLITLLVAFVAFQFVRERWYDRFYDDSGIVPASILAALICFIAMWLWHTFDFVTPANADVIIRPYLPGWIVWHFLRQFMWLKKPLGGANTAVHGFWGWIKTVAAIIVGIVVLRWLGVIDGEAIRQFWFAVDWFVLIAVIAWSTVYWFIRMVQYMDTYVFIEKGGGVYTVVSTFFITPFHFWRGDVKKHVDWKNIDETEERFWRPPLMKPFAPETQISYTTQRGFSVTLFCLAEMDYGRIGSISGKRREDSSVDKEVSHKLSVDEEMKRRRPPTP